MLITNILLIGLRCQIKLQKGNVIDFLSSTSQVPYTDFRHGLVLFTFYHSTMLTATCSQCLGMNEILSYILGTQ
jgi:hypothetical protein